MLYKELLKREWSTFDIASHKLLALFVMEWVTHPDPKAGMILRENLRYDIVSEELPFVELCEHSLLRLHLLRCINCCLHANNECHFRLQHLATL